MSQSPDVTMELDSSETAPAMARRFVEANADHLPAELIADAELLVTELVTNAVRHGRPKITVRIRLAPPLLGVFVQDAGPDTPSTDVVSAGTASASGRGLMIVDRLSSQWGVTQTRAAPGKIVWFELTATVYDAGAS